jgi:hypothetical protein
MQTQPTDTVTSGTAPSDTTQSGIATTTAELEPVPSPPTEPVTADPDLAPPAAELIAAIRAAITRGASPELRRAGASACRSLLAVFEAKPGQPLIASPPAAPTAPTPFTAFAAMLTQPGFLAQLAAMSREQLVEMLRQFTGATATKPTAPPTGAPRFHLIEIPHRSGGG